MVIKNITMLKNAPGVFFEIGSNQGLPAHNIKQKGPAACAAFYITFRVWVAERGIIRAFLPSPLRGHGDKKHHHVKKRSRRFF